MLSTLKSALGSLNRVKRLSKSLCMVNSHVDFTEHIYVANGSVVLLLNVSSFLNLF